MKSILSTCLFAVAFAAGAALAEYDGPGVSMKCDANKDGKITKEEHRAEADKCFDKTDTNHDGVVTQDEITACESKMKAGYGADKENKGQKGNPAPTPSQSPESKPSTGDTKPGGPTRTEGGEQPGSSNPSTKNNTTK